MKFTDYKELQAALDAGTFLFKPEYGPAFFRCADCGHGELNTTGSGCSTGYALEKDNVMLCYSCADNRQRAALKNHSGPFYAYLASDGRNVTTWTGGALGSVSSLGVSRSGWHGSEIARFHVQDVHGQWWQGRGAGRGMCCTLRRLKHEPR